MQESWASSTASRKSMQGNRGSDTRPEMAVRKLVHAKGLRYLVNVRPEKDLRRTADLVFTRVKIAVFIDGCFWHGCPEHYTIPIINGSFWAEKLQSNRARDLETNRQLTERGWTVLRFWEHQPASEVAESIATEVRERRGLKS
jgi:DNA mismatch endonuclease, patch repair protein